MPDGACIVSDTLTYNMNYPQGKSLEKVIEMISRDETGEYFHYSTFLEADKYFKNEALRYMSNFTSNYLNAIDYNHIKNKRQSNIQILKEELEKYNEIEIKSDNLTYMYPLKTEKGEELRKYLLKNNIYSQLLWPNVMWNGANESEQKLACSMVLLPIDQRYSEKEMIYISNNIKKYLKK